MLWELRVAEQRYRAVLEVGTGVPVTEVAERYGVSRQSVHTWLVRYRQEGIAGLEDRSHQVRHHPWRIPAEVEEVICELRRGHPKWGPRRLVFEMGRRGHQVTRSTVYRTLVRNGLAEPKPSAAQAQGLPPLGTQRPHGVVAAGRDRQRILDHWHGGQDCDRDR
jgi:transposase